MVMEKVVQNDWIYQQVIEAVAVFASHGNSGSSAPWEINLVQRLLFGYLNPYYRSAYNIPKRRK